MRDLGKNQKKVCLERFTKMNIVKIPNSYLPDRSYKGGEALEDLVKYLADDLIARLEELEKEADFKLLMSLGDDDISNEAHLLYQEIINLKTRLQEI
jgi:hypothetical protein